MIVLQLAQLFQAYDLDLVDSFARLCAVVLNHKFVASFASATMEQLFFHSSFIII